MVQSKKEIIALERKNLGLSKAQVITEIKTVNVFIQEPVGQKRTSRMEAWDTPTPTGQAENKKPKER